MHYDDIRPRCPVENCTCTYTNNLIGEPGLFLDMNTDQERHPGIAHEVRDAGIRTNQEFVRFIVYGIRNGECQQ